MCLKGFHPIIAGPLQLGRSALIFILRSCASQCVSQSPTTHHHTFTAVAVAKKTRCCRLKMPFSQLIWNLRSDGKDSSAAGCVKPMLCSKSSHLQKGCSGCDHSRGNFDPWKMLLGCNIYRSALYMFTVYVHLKAPCSRFLTREGT